MIDLNDITYRYPDGTPGLSHVSLHLQAGECCVLTGPNGSGKSTLFRILNGLAFPQSGSYLLDDQPITESYLRNKKNAAAFHRRIGYLFQNSETQLFTRSVEDEVAFGLWQLGLSKEEVHARTDHYLKMLSLTAMRHRAPFHLSGGEKKRCALAAVLAMEPQVLIMDEPLGGLDEEGQRWISDCIRSLKREDRLIILATHNRSLADSLADRFLSMNRNHELSTARNPHSEGLVNIENKVSADIPFM